MSHSYNINYTDYYKKKESFFKQLKKYINDVNTIVHNIYSFSDDNPIRKMLKHNDIQDIEDMIDIISKKIENLNEINEEYSNRSISNNIGNDSLMKQFDILLKIYRKKLSNVGYVSGIIGDLLNQNNFNDADNDIHLIRSVVIKLLFDKIYDDNNLTDIFKNDILPPYCVNLTSTLPSISDDDDDE